MFSFLTIVAVMFVAISLMAITMDRKAENK
jgi:hypothetical protein